MSLNLNTKFIQTSNQSCILPQPKELPSLQVHRDLHREFVRFNTQGRRSFIL